MTTKHFCKTCHELKPVSEMNNWDECWQCHVNETYATVFCSKCGNIVGVNCTDDKRRCIRCQPTQAPKISKAKQTRITKELEELTAKGPVSLDIFIKTLMQ